MRNTNTWLAACGLLLAAGGVAEAGTVSGGSLLTGTDADQLETWFGLPDQDFSLIWSGVAGDATADSFHAAAAGVGPTFSIYGVTLGNGTEAKIGGYTTVDWAGPTGYVRDTEAAIFNLTIGEIQRQQPGYENTAVYRRTGVDAYFPTFGGGHDLFGGYGILGQCSDTVNSICDGYTRSWSYDPSQGQISFGGDFGQGSGSSGANYRHIRVNSLEVFTSSDALAVPVPMGLPLAIGAFGLWGAISLRRRRAAAG
ncbi:MAG: PEP_CTERM-anchored TLD domain-containing protein [Pseudomonadota bacterium]